MKIIGFAGSTSSNSINKKLVNYTLNCIESDSYEKELIDLNDYKCPIFNVDEEENGYPENAKMFIEKLSQADGFVVSMAEHNGSYAAEVKNLLDWCSRIQLGFFKNKPMFLMSTSPGGYGGGNVLEAAKKQFPKFQANIIESYKLPFFNDNFDAKSGITNNELRESHMSVLQSFFSNFE